MSTASTTTASLASPSDGSSPAPFEAFLTSIGAGRAANRAAAVAAAVVAVAGGPSSPSSPASSKSTTTTKPNDGVPPPQAHPATSADGASTPPTTSSPSLISPVPPPSSSASSSSSSSPPSTAPSSTAAVVAVSGVTAGEERASEGRASSPRLEATSPTTPNSSGGNGTATPAPPAFDVTSSSGREALLLRFLQLLPSTHDLQQPLNQPTTTTTGAAATEETTKACQQLLSEVVTALRLWVVQQPLTLGRPLGDDNPSLFALMRPQLRQLHWWRAAAAPATVSSSSSSAAPSHYPTSAAALPEPPLSEDLLALAWGNRAWQPAPVGPVQKSEEGSPTLSSPTRATSPARSLAVPVVKVEQPPHAGNFAVVNNGSSSSAAALSRQHGSAAVAMPPTVIGTIKLPGPMPIAGQTNSNEGFEFNENDSALTPVAQSALALNKRRRSMDASLEVPGGHLALGRQPRDQALRKRRKSVIERTSRTTVIVHQEETESVTVVGAAGAAARDLRKRKASLPSLSAAAASVDDLNSKKTKFDDEDYIDSRETADKEKEVHRDVADSATPIRGARGRGRGRGSRGMRARGRGGRASTGGSTHADKDLDGVPKTKARKPESCHRCKNKKEFWVGCPLVASHKYCRGCVVRHFSIDYDDFRANPENYWTDGCPICHLTCPCIGCVRKKKNGQGSGAEDDKVDVEREEDDEVGDPDEDEDDGYGYGYDEDGDGEEDEVNVDVDNDNDHNDEDDEDEMSEEKSAENLIEVKWLALKRQLDVKDAASGDSADNTGQHLPVKKRMSRMRSNSFANGPSSRGSSSSASLAAAAAASFLDEPYVPQQIHQQPPRKRPARLRSYSTSHCEPKATSSAAVNPEDYLGCTGAGNVLAARYSSPMRRGSRGFNSRTHNH